MELNRGAGRLRSQEQAGSAPTRDLHQQALCQPQLARVCVSMRESLVGTGDPTVVGPQFAAKPCAGLAVKRRSQYNIRLTVHSDVIVATHQLHPSQSLLRPLSGLWSDPIGRVTPPPPTAGPFEVAAKNGPTSGGGLAQELAWRECTGAEPRSSWPARRSSWSASGPACSRSSSCCSSTASSSRILCRRRARAADPALCVCFG